MTAHAHVHAWRLSTPAIDYAFSCTGNERCTEDILVFCSGCNENLCARHAAEVLDIPPADRDERFAWGLERQEREMFADADAADTVGIKAWRLAVAEENIRRQSEVREFHLASKAGSV